MTYEFKEINSTATWYTNDRELRFEDENEYKSVGDSTIKFCGCF